MSGLDTYVLVRYLMQDEPTQAGRATAFIERQLSAERFHFARGISRDRLGTAQLLRHRS